MPIAVINFALFVLVIGLARALAWFFADFTVKDSELWSVLGVSITAGVIYQYVPKRSRDAVARRIRNLLSRRKSAVWLSILALVLTIPTLLLTRIDLEWRGPPTITLTVNETRETVRSDWSPDENHKSRRYGISFSKVTLKEGGWVSAARLYPLMPQSIQIPIWVTASSTAELRAIEEQLSLTFFQFFEARYLATAKNMLSVLSKAEPGRLAAERLDLIYQILRLSFVEADLSHNKALLLSHYAKRFPNDPWTSLLRAATLYASKQYVAAADILKVPLESSDYPKLSTSQFFTGVCLLRAARDTKGEHEKRKLFERALASFGSAHQTLTSETDEFYRSIALPSSVHFQGIVYYYQGRVEDTIRMFEEAANIASGGLKARALNGVGYIHLSKGNLPQAELALLKAMESDPTFPLARSNYGYVLLAKSDLKTAKNVFARNASDERLKLESYRDVVLARLALVHLAEIDGVSASEAISNYEPILADRKIQDYTGVTPERFRLANIHRAIAKNVYLDKDYYGLEVFALTLLTRAYLEAKDVLDERNGDEHVHTFLKQLAAEIDATKATVSPDWLTRHQSGWFATIGEYESNIRSPSAQPSVAADAPQAARR